MKKFSAIVALMCLVLLETTQYAHGGAVMSVDLGSEWMKVKF